MKTITKGDNLIAAFFARIQQIVDILELISDLFRHVID